MRVAQVSFAMTVGLVVTIAIRGAADWSRSFAIAWWGLLGLAALLAAGGIGVAVLGRLPLPRRTVIVVLSLPALLTLAGAVLLVYIVVSLHLTD